MKNTMKNKEKWVKKVEDTLKIGGRSKRTFDNYKSHLNRFLNYFKLVLFYLFFLILHYFE